MAKYDITYNDAWRKVFFGGLRIYTAVDLDVQKKAEDVFINRKTMPDVEDTEENPAPQAAMTIMDYNGRVIAMVGGAGKKESFRGLNRACNSPRQPGSSIKPLSVYAPAVEANFVTWSTMVQNYGIRMGSSRWPINYGGNPGSPSSFVTVQYALQQSLNTVPAQIVRQLGISPCFDFLVEDLHFSHLVTDEEDPNYDGNYSSVCVGGMSEGVTTLEMAAAYAAFANGGIYYEPYTISKIVYRDTGETFDVKNEGTRIMSDSTAYMITHSLEYTVTDGLANGVALKGINLAAKTGTTNFTNSQFATFLDENGIKAIKKLVQDLDDEKVYFVVGHKMTGYEKAVLDAAKELNKKFEINAIVPKEVSAEEVDNILKENINGIRISTEREEMGIYKSFNYEIFERRNSIVVAFDGNSPVSNLVQEAKNGKGKAKIYVNSEVEALKDKANSLGGYVKEFKVKDDLANTIFTDYPEIKINE